LGQAVSSWFVNLVKAIVTRAKGPSQSARAILRPRSVPADKVPVDLYTLTAALSGSAEAAGFPNAVAQDQL
jgi:hypothetical protein